MSQLKHKCIYGHYSKLFQLSYKVCIDWKKNNWWNRLGGLVGRTTNYSWQQEICSQSKPYRGVGYICHSSKIHMCLVWVDQPASYQYLYHRWYWSIQSYSHFLRELKHQSWNYKPQLIRRWKWNADLWHATFINC